MYDSLKFINQAVFTVLVIGISTYLATKNVISVGAVLTAYLCFNQLLKPSIFSFLFIGEIQQTHGVHVKFLHHLS